MNHKQAHLSRRQFLKVAGLAGIAAGAARAGYDVIRPSLGDAPPGLPSLTDATDNTTAVVSVNNERGPLLVLGSRAGSNPFGCFLAEILRAEGLTGFGVADASAIDRIDLAGVEIILLAEVALGSNAADRLCEFVSRGGGLIAMRPDRRLADLLGARPANGLTVDGYLRVNTDHPAGQGIVSEDLQFHGPADHYTPDGAEIVAWLVDKPGEKPGSPAVSIRTFGSGRAVLWAFDLARSIAYTRQGNPAWANEERDGVGGIRPNDMFKGWIDLDRLAIPQADEQQRLLVNLMHAIGQDMRPLARWWYFPNNAPGMLIATADCHSNPVWAIQKEIDIVERQGGHITIYNMPPLYSLPRRLAQRLRWWAADAGLMDEAYLPSPSQVGNWRARGHEFGIHPVVENGLEECWRDYWEAFTGLGYGPVPPTTRTHNLVWTGWVESARMQARYGMRMSLDYYNFGPVLRKSSGEWTDGHMTGSGLPMKFVDETGQILDIYQQATQLADDHLLRLPWGGQLNLTVEEAIAVSESLFDRSLRGGYAAIGAIFHVDPFAAGAPYAIEAEGWLEGTLAAAVARHFFIWTAQKWLEFTEARHDAVVRVLEWDRSLRRATLRVASNSASDAELVLLIPTFHSRGRLVHLELDGSEVHARRRTVGSVEYAGVPISPGTHDLVTWYSHPSA